ncbi:MAG: PqqD family protein [Ruminococcaceae bacterium]|nr:PqqD family protein [Oscillospiraceae bacterium]
MKLSENFVLKNIAGENVVMPVGDAVGKINGMIKLNPSAKVIWNALEENKDVGGILEEMKKNFQGVDDETLKEDINYFLNKLREHEILVD